MDAKRWYRHGFLNTLEMAITRASDALTSFVLLWALLPEIFSRLALAQAIVAPTLFFFLSPETVLYRDYRKWKSQGKAELYKRLCALRYFAWAKGALALILAAVLSSFSSDSHAQFAGLIWAFSLTVGPQLSGADREFLRLSLRLKELNAITIFQKLSLLILTASVALLTANLALIALAAVFSVVSTAVLSWWVARKCFSKIVLNTRQTNVLQTLKEPFRTFVFWQHLTSVLGNWIKTMDILIFGILGLPAREIGLYSAVLRAGNLVSMLPQALTNLFSIWLGRREPEKSPSYEYKKIWVNSAWLLVINSLQGTALYVLAPYLFQWLSHGRWSSAELEVMHTWLKWIVISLVLQTTFSPYGAWLVLRTKVAGLFYWVHIPWGIAAWGVYYYYTVQGSFMGAARAHIAVSLLFSTILVVYYYFARKKHINDATL